MQEIAASLFQGNSILDTVVLVTYTALGAALGFALGGPIGAAIGAAIGNAVGKLLIDPEIGRRFDDLGSRIGRFL